MNKMTAYSLLSAAIVLSTCFSFAQTNTLFDSRLNQELFRANDSDDSEHITSSAIWNAVHRHNGLNNKVTDSSAGTGSTSATKPAATTNSSEEAVLAIRAVEPPPPRVQWKSLMLQSNLYLGIMHGFRIATEPSTRMGLHNSVFGGYFKALGAMHGWSDGDGYYENYLGHPLQGAASGYLWINHDPRYAATEFGSSRDYWMGRLRAAGFAWAFSEQFEVGPISEASVGQIQRYCCAYGFVDHVITPTAGLAWLVGEDIVDKYITRSIEDHTRNRAIRIIARVGLNPAESFANVITFHAPWHRNNRPGILTYDRETYVRPATLAGNGAEPLVPKFEIAAELPSSFRWGKSESCLGGGAVGATRLSNSWQWTLQIGGCALRNQPKNWSGDSLTFTTGPQWILHTRSRWSPHAHLRVGGQKVTQEYVDPMVKQSVLSNVPPGVKPSSLHGQYAKDFETTGPALSMGGGLDFRLHPALALRLANLEYVPAWLAHLNGMDVNQGLRVSTGFVLRIGTW